MRIRSLLLPVLALVLFVGCAAPVAVSHLSLEVHRDDIDISDHPFEVDSTHFHLYHVERYASSAENDEGQILYVTRLSDAVKYNESGHVLRKHSQSVRIWGRSGDTLRHHSFGQNYYNDKGELIEHHGFESDTLDRVLRFAYNDKGQLVEQVTQYMPEEAYVPYLIRYTYDRYGNISSEERYENGELQSRTLTRYNRRGNMLEESLYRGDGVLEEKRIYSYNRYGDKVESTRIEESGKMHFTSCGDMEVNRFERTYWLEHRPEWKPIVSYDTIRYRDTYHSRGKIATSQKWDSTRGEWQTTQQTEYNSQGVPTKRYAYITHGQEQGVVQTLTLYNSRGLPAEEYTRDRKSGELQIRFRKEYNDRGEVVLELHYHRYGKRPERISALYSAYDSEGNKVEEWSLDDNGSLAWRTVTEYEDGREVKVVRYGKKGKLKSTKVVEAEGDVVRTTVTDPEGTVTSTSITQKNDQVEWYREYDQKGELVREIRLDYFESGAK